MEDASEELDFEKAAIMRDKIKSLNIIQSSLTISDANLIEAGHRVNKHEDNRHGFSGVSVCLHHTWHTSLISQQQCGSVNFSDQETHTQTLRYLTTRTHEKSTELFKESPTDIVNQNTSESDQTRKSFWLTIGFCNFEWYLWHFLAIQC